MITAELVGGALDGRRLPVEDPPPLEVVDWLEWADQRSEFTYEIAATVWEARGFSLGIPYPGKPSGKEPKLTLAIYYPKDDLQEAFSGLDDTECT